MESEAGGMKKESNPVYKRVYIRIKGMLGSPLLVGSGENRHSDGDVILDAYGNPFVPGSSLAGALRDYVTVVLGKETANVLLGSLEGGQSPLIVYDTEFENGFSLALRDGVKLDRFKTGEYGGKYEVQVVESGAQYRMRLEMVLRAKDLEKPEANQEEHYLQWIRQMIMALGSGEIILGAKSRRGFGKLKINEVRVKKFDLRKSEECNVWLNWDWEKDNAFGGADLWEFEKVPARYHCLRVPLEIQGSIMIRQYAPLCFDRAQGADYEQRQAGGRAVIPGSSWLGAIRSRIAFILEEINPKATELGAQTVLEEIFGTWLKEQEEQQELRASLVRVEESIIEGGHGLPQTRNAIDRFTGGTVRGALYTSVPWVSGRTELVLRWPKDIGETLHHALCGLLLWAIEDLQKGLLAVGGETAMGRGVFQDCGKVTLDGVVLDDKRPYYQAALHWCQQQGDKGEGADETAKG